MQLVQLHGTDEGKYITMPAQISAPNQKSSFGKLSMINFVLTPGQSSKSSSISQTVPFPLVSCSFKRTSVLGERQQGGK